MFRILRYLLLFSGVLIFTSSISASTINVPADSVTIQAGINGAVTGDTVLVAPGTYTGDGNRDIDFGGKNIVVMSSHGPLETIIDCEGSASDPHRGFFLHYNEDTTAKIIGFTITNGYAPEFWIMITPFDLGGGIFCFNSSPTIKNNIIYGNKCPFNYYSSFGGGIAVMGSGGNPLIINNVILGNIAPDVGGIYCYNATIKNNIVCGNMNGEISTSEAIITYCNIQGGWPGEGNIDTFPYFVNSSMGNFTLCSQSPCIDAGDPALLDPDGSRSDIGVYLPDYSDCAYPERDVIYVSVEGDDATGDGSPENPYATIQTGLNTAMSGDTVIVNDGIYNGFGNRELDFMGKGVLLMSTNGPEYTIINCESFGRGFNFHSGEDTTAVVSGFTIKNGSALAGGGIYIENAGPSIINNWIIHNGAGSGYYYSDGRGAGIFCSNSAPVIKNNLIEGNYLGWTGIGSAIYCINSSPVITDNTIDNNGQTCHSTCGGVFISNCDALIKNNVVSNNVSWSGSVVEISGGTVQFEKNTIFGNLMLEYGRAINCSDDAVVSIINSIISCNMTNFESSGCNWDGLPGAWLESEDFSCVEWMRTYLDTATTTTDTVYEEIIKKGAVNSETADVTITNSIIWCNGWPEISFTSGSEPFIDYSIIKGGWPGIGNFDTDPLFIDPFNGDFNVCAGSPAIDAGDPARLDPDDSRSDIGLYFPEHPDCNLGTVWHVATTGSDETGDGSSGNPFQTIQRAVNQAHSRDTILVARGTYYDKAVILYKNLVLTSNYIYSQDSLDIYETVLYGDSFITCLDLFYNDRSCKVTGFKITGCFSPATFQKKSGGIYCGASDVTLSHNYFFENTWHGAIDAGRGSRPTIHANLIEHNKMAIQLEHSSGFITDNILTRNYFPHTVEAGISCVDSDPEIRNNLITNNYAGIYLQFGTTDAVITNNIIDNNGYGIYSWGGEGLLSNNTLIRNGTAIYLDERIKPTIENCIIAYNNVSIFCYWDDVYLTLTNCDLFGNTSGDWSGCIEDQLGVNGNFSDNPVFCDTTIGDYSLSAYSPCRAENNPGGQLIGALDMGCSGMYRCADADNDSLVDINDINMLIDYYFTTGLIPYPYFASDLNCDRKVNLLDIVYLAMYLYAEGAEPCCIEYDK